MAERCWLAQGQPMNFMTYKWFEIYHFSLAYTECVASFSGRRYARLGFTALPKNKNVNPSHTVLYLPHVYQPKAFVTVVSQLAHTNYRTVHPLSPLHHQSPHICLAATFGNCSWKRLSKDAGFPEQEPIGHCGIPLAQIGQAKASASLAARNSYSSATLIQLYPMGFYRDSFTYL